MYLPSMSIVLDHLDHLADMVFVAFLNHELGTHFSKLPDMSNSYCEVLNCVSSQFVLKLFFFCTRDFSFQLFPSHLYV